MSLERITSFIDSASDYFEDDGEAVAFAAGQFGRYRTFLEIIMARYLAACRDFFENQAHKDASIPPEMHHFTPDLRKLFEDGKRIHQHLHLRDRELLPLCEDPAR